jgi:hypothetical protein
MVVVPDEGHRSLYNPKRQRRVTTAGVIILVRLSGAGDGTSTVGGRGGGALDSLALCGVL